MVSMMVKMMMMISFPITLIICHRSQPSILSYEHSHVCIYLRSTYHPTYLKALRLIPCYLPTYSVIGWAGSSYEGSHGVVCMLEIDCMKADATSEASLPTSCRRMLLMPTNLSCHLLFVLFVILSISLVIILSLD